MEHVKRFDSWGDYLQYVDQEPPADARSSREGGERFTGTRDWGHAMDLARRGWPEGLEEARVALRAVEAALGQVRTRRPSLAVVGGAPSVPRAVQGHPAAMWRLEDHHGQGGAVTVALDAAVSSGVPRRTITQRGAAAVALVRAADLAGLATRVVVSWTSEKRGARATTQVVLKEHGDPLDLDLLAFALAHPSSGRRLQFSALEQAPAAIRRKLDVSTHLGYGRPSDTPGLADQEGVVHLGKALLGEGAWSDSEWVAQWVADTLGDYGVQWGGRQ